MLVEKGGINVYNRVVTGTYPVNQLTIYHVSGGGRLSLLFSNRYMLGESKNLVYMRDWKSHIIIDMVLPQNSCISIFKVLKIAIF